MFGFCRRFPWVLEPFVYLDVATLLGALSDKVVAPAEQKVREHQRG